VTGPKVTLGQRKKHLRRILDQMESVYWQLIGLEKSQPESLAERVRHEDMSDDMDPSTELRTVLACVLNDLLRPALQEVRGLLARTEDDEDEEEP
jgi:hypothetical protein